MTQDEWVLLRAEFGRDPRKAFERLYHRLWARMFSVSLSYVRDKCTAQEIVQEVFIGLWLKRDSLRDVNNIDAFAMRAVQNRIYDYFDKRAVEGRYRLELSRDTYGMVNATDHQIEYEETCNLLDTEIDKLPGTTKTVFKLSRFDHRSNHEIATILQLSVKTVEYHITRALRKLRVGLKYTGSVLLLLFTGS